MSITNVQGWQLVGDFATSSRHLRDYRRWGQRPSIRFHHASSLCQLDGGVEGSGGDDAGVGALGLASGSFSRP